MAQTSFVSYLLDHQTEYCMSDDEVAYLAGSMFGAGSETVSRTSISWPYALSQ